LDASAVAAVKAAMGHKQNSINIEKRKNRGATQKVNPVYHNTISPVSKDDM